LAICANCWRNMFSTCLNVVRYHGAILLSEWLLQNVSTNMTDYGNN
jgi:hypothetical protein